MRLVPGLYLLIVMSLFASPSSAEDFTLKQRSLPKTEGSTERILREEKWPTEGTAVIVCDAWDLHHSQNAVRRLEEFAPRLNEFLKAARDKGAIIIHAPSDCMAAYETHPARVRARAVPLAMPLPRDIDHWCSRIPSEEGAAYPLDQSDGGDDDDPAEHAVWAEKLKALGRNPNMPWKRQTELLTIDPEKDFISDEGGIVWSILRHRGIKRVILTGVHTNMCVVGRPFGLRQMVRNGMQALLVRDLTDCMYNPKRYPFVDHFTGNDLLTSYVERTICSTITSDQILGGKPFRSQFDKRKETDVASLPAVKRDRSTLEKTWSPINVPFLWERDTDGVIADYAGPAWYRCAVRAPSDWAAAEGLAMVIPKLDVKPQAWLNGRPLPVLNKSDGIFVFRIVKEDIALDDANLLVLRLEHRAMDGGLNSPPFIQGTGAALDLKGRWQFRLGDDASFSNIPLPARYGTSPDMYFEPKR